MRDMPVLEWQNWSFPNNRYKCGVICEFEMTNRLWACWRLFSQNIMKIFLLPAVISTLIFCSNFIAVDDTSRIVCMWCVYCTTYGMTYLYGIIKKAAVISALPILPYFTLLCPTGMPPNRVEQGPNDINCFFAACRKWPSPCRVRTCMAIYYHKHSITLGMVFGTMGGRSLISWMACLRGFTANGFGRVLARP